ncbi:RNA polymerase sigma factor [Cellulomonas fimi]|uniref:RNA polymerase, sigma-24 subunit, ECF subfamily n=1 Tax=Cellulomonas fimi (strain ATCC 484 / DSM 20113 / JCM 1341 / CCUG 24087 / LMG 16345 / NBRC 15513 / NCIMB 8980 / NCTC 7547 / NRS-133) TaxID=590998 RepID=F4H0L7_CELFA|nr:sigma-70 family RNA polymerase sigma factor [Cellulomonas fimi]AEE44990.1 RNA polymerase, sigma-24 subunit, ECF subfamily [Cellulomonas fimi ATCC 484]NNH08971.1 sigma-70 family RNA polymerase sigma factor [Cellulomonas fimi]VEH27903.1 RNA polymerase sigma-E factor [Cellulomonas fimi]
MAAWEQVLDDLVQVRGHALVRYATLLTGDRREAEDLVQEALVRCFGQTRPLRDAVAAEAYVRRAVLSVFLDGHRQRSRWSAVRHLVARHDVEESPEQAAVERASVEAALATLAPRLRATVVLRFYDDLTVPEIARRLGLADGTVKRYLSDAIDALEPLLGPLHAARTTDIELVSTREGR